MTQMLRDETKIEESATPGLTGDKRAKNGVRASLQPGVFLMTDSFDTGGSERQFAALAQSLDPSSFRLSLGCIQKRGAFLDSLGEVPEFGLGGSLYGLQSIRTRLRLRRHLRALDIAVAHAFDFYTNLTLIPAARMARTPIVIGSQRQLGDLLSSTQFRIQTAMFRWCDAVVCNSQAAANVLLEHGLPQHKIAVITNGLPPSCFAETAPALPWRPGILRVGMIARMNTEAKNHRDFLRAAARIHGVLGDVEFILVGDGPLREQFEHEAQRLGLGEHVQFLGDRRDVTSILASLHVSVLPSASESLSNVIIESMAAGVPVIANNVGGNTELVSADRGVLVTAGDDEALANAIERLLRDANLRAQFGHNAKRFALANFTVDQMRKRHEDLYAGLLERKSWRAMRFRQPTSPPTPKGLHG